MKQIYSLIIILALLVSNSVFAYLYFQQKQLLDDEKTVPPPVSANDSLEAVLAPPAPNASQEEKDKHYLLAVSLAEEAQSLDITQCSPKPVVFKMRQNAALKLFNNDNIAHIIRFGDKAFKAEEHKTTEIKDSFFATTGLYGYTCDGASKIAGLILVVPE